MAMFVHVLPQRRLKEFLPGLVCWPTRPAV
jgi:hypothetical protein